MTEPEDPLQQRIQEGDADALAELIDRERVALLGYLAKITGEHLRSKTELDDLFQEVSFLLHEGALPATRFEAAIEIRCRIDPTTLLTIH